MWFEIIPTFAIITTFYGLPHVLIRLVNRSVHEGNPAGRSYEDWNPYQTTYFRRDKHHCYNTWWEKYFRPNAMGEGNTFRPHGLEQLD
uniref:Uncharacterized protein n=1 Tax=Acartia pacifica TaxID=335913 RepID=A0A0U2TK37_ACAPC|nr:hypothetical protein [Acartia pacifica]